MKIRSFHNDIILILIMSMWVFLLHCTHREMQKNMINIEGDRYFIETTNFRNFIKEESASHLTSSWLWCQRRCLKFAKKRHEPASPNLIRRHSEANWKSDGIVSANFLKSTSDIFLFSATPSPIVSLFNSEKSYLSQRDAQ